jgi:hypothetical protein
MNAAKEKSDEISNKVGIQNEQLYIFIIWGWYRNGMQIYIYIYCTLWVKCGQALYSKRMLQKSKLQLLNCTRNPQVYQVHVNDHRHASPASYYQLDYFPHWTLIDDWATSCWPLSATIWSSSAASKQLTVVPGQNPVVVHDIVIFVVGRVTRVPSSCEQLA